MTQTWLGLGACPLLALLGALVHRVRRIGKVVNESAETAEHCVWRMRNPAGTRLAHVVLTSSRSVHDGVNRPASNPQNDRGEPSRSSLCSAQ